MNTHIWRNTDVKERIDQRRMVDANGCHIYTFFKNPRGYGKIKVDGKPWVVHRLWWVLHNGEIPKGQYVLHKCDNPGCFNLEHLFLGSHSDNMNDKVNKNRQYRPPSGKAHQRSMAKLTKEKVLQIKELLKRGYKQRDIAKDFGVHHATISDIYVGNTWVDF